MSRLEQLAAAVVRNRQEQVKWARHAANGAGMLSEAGVKHAKLQERAVVSQLRNLKAALVNELEAV